MATVNKRSYSATT